VNVATQRLAAPRTIGGIGIALGVLAFWLTLPPFTLRSLAAPLLVGIVACTFGVAALIQGERKAGGFAVAVGILGIAAGAWALSVDSDTLKNVLTAGLLASTLRFATPLAFAALGGIFSERSGVVNIGLEGMMLFGAFFAVWGSIWSGSWLVGLLMAAIFGGLLALIHAFFSIHLRADQIVSGFAVNLLALGVTGYLFSAIYTGGISASEVSRVPQVELHFLGDIPFVGNFLQDVFGDLNLLVWLMFLAVILTYVILFKTAIGLRIRSVGEHPRAADTVGINVYLVRYGSVVLSGILAAMGGAYLTVGYLNTFNENVTYGKGFIALAAVIFGNWRPFGAFGAALLFGFSTALAYRLPAYSSNAATLFQALPYVLTLIAVAGVIGRTVPPAADGRPYKKQ
jgi:general nucleoside transport system permease protein